MTEKVSSTSLFARAFRSCRLPSAREERNGRKRNEKAAGPRNPERQPIRKQFSVHLGRSGKSSTLLVERKREGAGGGGGESERSHKAARGKNLHSRTRINIPGETNVTDRSNLHLTGKRCSVSISTDYRSPLVALLRPCPRAFPRPSAFSSETYIVPRFSNAILSHAVLSRPLYFSRG